jgi:plasmid stability protein
MTMRQMTSLFSPCMPCRRVLITVANPTMEMTLSDPSPVSGPAPAATHPNGAVTIRGLTPALKSRLRVRAAHNDRSMEAEARAILEAALAAPEEDTTDLAAFARALFASLGGLELDPPPRDPVRHPPGFAMPAAETQATAAPAPASPAGAAKKPRPPANKRAAPKRRPAAGTGGRHR